MNKINIFDFITTKSVNVTFEHILINLLVTVVVALFIFWVYRKTYTGVIYSKEFNVTLVMVSMVTSMIMMVIGSNLALSLGMVGALSIVRFRSAIKDPKDIGFLFWAIASGLAAGTGSYLIVIVGSLVVAIVMFIINRDFGNIYPYIIIIKGQKIDEEKIRQIIEKNTIKSKLKMRSKSMEEEEIIYEISFKENEEKVLLDSFDDFSNILSVNILSYKGEIIE